MGKDAWSTLQGCLLQAGIIRQRWKTGSMEKRERLFPGIFQIAKPVLGHIDIQANIIGRKKPEYRKCGNPATL